MNPTNCLKKYTVSLYIILLLLASVAPTIIFEYYPYVRIGTALLAVFSLFFALYFVLQIINNNKEINKSVQLNKIDFTVVLFFVYILVRYVSSPAYRNALEDIVVICICFLSYFFVRFKLSNCSEEILSNTLYVIMLFSLTQSVLSLCQWFGLARNIFTLFQLGGTYGNPGDLANVLLIGFAISFGLLIYEQKRTRKIVPLISTLAITATILLTSARTAWIAVIIILLCLLKKQLIQFLSQIKSKLSTLALLLIFGVVIGGSIYGGTKLYQMKEGSANGRIFIWGQCIELITEKPLFGHGYDSFITVYGIKQANYFKTNLNDTKNSYLADDILFAYNEYLHWGVEYGIIGLLFICLLLFLVFKPRSSNNQTHHPSIINIIRAAIVGIGVSMLFSYPLQNVTILLTLFMLTGIFSSQLMGTEFNFNINGGKRPFIYGLGVLIFSFLLYVSIAFNSYSLLWKDTYENSTIAADEKLEQYDTLINVLKYDKLFLYHYGAYNYENQVYDKSRVHFEKYKSNTLNSKVLLILGDCYKEIGNAEMAEEYYTRAMYTKPSLFGPKYKLLTFYKSTNQVQKAREIAHNIQQSKIKVYSETVKNIKQEANHYLLNSGKN